VKSKSQIVFLIIVLAFSLLLIVTALSMPYFSSKLLPVIVGSLVSVLAVVELVKELRGVKASGGGSRSGTAAKSFHGYLLAALWFGGYFVGVYLLGFLIVTALFTFLYMKLHNGRWLSSIAYSVVTTGAIWMVFQVLMKASLYRGVLIEMLF